MTNCWKLGDAPKEFATGWTNTQGDVKTQKASDSYGQFYQKTSTGAGIQKSTWLGYKPLTTDKPHYTAAAFDETNHHYGQAPQPVSRPATSSSAYGGFAVQQPAPVSAAYPGHEAAQPTAISQPAAISSVSPEQPQNGAAPVRDINTIIAVFRENIAKRGARGIFGLGRSFRIIDDDRSHTLSWEEFSKAFNDFQVDLSRDERELLFKAFDINNDGQVNYEEFLRGVIGEMNAFRKSLVQKAFNFFDKDGNGVVNSTDLKGVYNTKFHPDVISGKKTENEVFIEFLNTFEDHYAARHGGERDGEITPEEFEEYYNNISMSIDLDSYFELMITNAWNLKKVPAAKTGWGGAY